jgi:hypothetical protein
MCLFPIEPTSFFRSRSNLWRAAESGQIIEISMLCSRFPQYHSTPKLWKTHISWHLVYVIYVYFP